MQEEAAQSSASQSSAPQAAEQPLEAPEDAAAPAHSTLIEFPGVSRVARPQWRKELSERVREIQERRARESGQDETSVSAPARRPAVAEPSVATLGLVPQPKTPEVNPIVAAALKRLERARQPMPRPRAGVGRGAAAAAARVTEEQYETEVTPALSQQLIEAPAAELLQAPSESPKAEALPEPKLPEAKPPEPVRERPLSVVPAPKVATTLSKPQPRHRLPEAAEAKEPGVASDEQTTDVFKDEDYYDDRAPVASRLAAGFVDLLVAAFASSPFAAVIELTNGNWSDWRVLASMGAIFLVVTFLYLTASTALAGRTWGMSITHLRAVDADTGASPTTKQSVGRALLYIISLLTLGLGILYSLFDAEGRTVHDHLSGTAVVKE